MPAKPCPFCGCALFKTRNGWAHPDRKSGSTCREAGTHIGNAIIETHWNPRAPLFMEVIDGAPVFNTDGEGRPVSVDLVNQTIEYFRAKPQ